MSLATTLQVGTLYRCEITGLTHYNKASGQEYPHSALVEFVLIDDAGEIVPEVVMVHFDSGYFEDPYGAYEEDARKAFHEDWKAGTVRVFGVPA